MESKNKSLVPERKMKLNSITNYLHLSQRAKDYILLLSETNQLSLFAAHNLELLSKFTVSIAKPIKLLLDGQNNVILIDSAGLCIWTVSQIVSKCHPQKIRFEWPSPPLQLIPLGHEEYVAVCSQRKLLFLGRQGYEREGSYIQEFVMEDLQHVNLYTTQDQLFVMVPSTTHNYPYIFTRDEVKKWQSAGFLDKYYGACRNYYMEDEVLSKQECRMTMAPEMKMVCVVARKELTILEWRNHSEIGLVLSRRISIVALWQQCPWSCTISGKTGEVAYASKDRVGIIHPLEYTTLKRSVKQKTDHPFNWIKHSGNLMLMISHSDQTKLFRAFMISLFDA